MSKNQTLGKFLNWLELLLIWGTASSSIYLIVNHANNLAASDWENLIVIGIIGIWRWSWLALHFIRSIFYRAWVFPRWRRQANRILPEQLPQIAIVIPTYKEKPWITERVFRAIALEAKTLHQRLVLVTVSTREENIAIGKILRSHDPQGKSIHFIPLLDPNNGKRGALANGLEALARLNLPTSTVVALMDGDSILSPGSLRLALPFFKMFPRMGGLTTNEMSEVHGSYLFSEWLNLRFAQRNQYMCSHALSRKVLCLTGRCSFFRGEAALHPSFRNLLANDYLNDWLWGQFRFFSGDDKSTWYWLLRQGYDMLYLPDVMVCTVETISGSLRQRVYQNLRRWSGNMLRNGTRALALGPRKVGFFIWLCLLDQRISIWTTLISPAILSFSLLQGKWVRALIICLWLVASRSTYLTLIFWGRESRLKLIHIPIMLMAQWSSSLVKMWTQMNLAQQKWTNRHADKGSSFDGLGLQRLVKVGSARFLLFCQAFSFAVFLLWQYGTLHLGEDIAGWWWSEHSIARSIPVQTIVAIDRGVYPSDRRDDSVALQALIDSLPSTGIVQIDLPIGEIDLFQPLKIARSNTILRGGGTQGTILQVNRQALGNRALVSIEPPERSSNSKIENIQLTGLSVNLAKTNNSKIPGIVLENVNRAALKNLRLYNSGERALVLSRTQNVTVEYLAIESASAQKAIEVENSANTRLKGVTLMAERQVE